MKIGEVLLERYALWEEEGTRYIDGISRQRTTYIDVNTGFFIDVVVLHGSQVQLPVKERAPFLISVWLSYKAKKFSKLLLEGPFMTREEALSKISLNS